MKKLLVVLLVLFAIFALISCDDYVPGATEPHYHVYNGESFDPTCIKGGYHVYTCECGDTYEEFWCEPTGECSYEDRIEYAPTFTTPGYYEYVCTVCGESITENFMDPLTPTEGLIYELNEEQNGYVIVGTTEDYHNGDVVVIPDFYEDLPVVEIAEGVVLGSPIRFFIFDNLTKIAPSSLSSQVRSYFVSENNPAYCSVDGVLYSKDMKTLVKFAEGGTGMGEDIFIEYNIPDSVETIGDYAFNSYFYDGTMYLEQITIGSNVKTIGNCAFMGCRSFLHIELNDGLISIGDKAFSGCENLVSISLGDSVEIIGNGAFQSCKALVSVYFPSSVQSLGDSLFVDCVALTEITVAEDNAAYKSVEGVLYTEDGRVLMAYPVGNTKESFSVPNGVETINAYAFYYAQQLKELIMSETLIAIEEHAFEGSILLENISFSDSLKTIGEFAFRGCIALDSVVLGNNVESVDEYAFYQCRLLVEVYIPKSVTYLGGYSFGESTLPMKVTYEGADADWGSITFDWSSPFSGSTVSEMIFLGDEE